MVVRIKENSWLAKLAAKKLKSNSVALVMGKTIYLYNATKDEFIRNNKWLRHELAHVQQFARYGRFTFLLLYLLESIRKGYYKNRFEVEARNKEIENTSISEYIIQ